MRRAKHLGPLAQSWVLALLTLGCGVASDDTEVAEARVTSGLLARYDFQEGSGSIVHDTSGNGTPLDLSAQGSTQVSWTSGGLRLNASGLFASANTATKITQPIRGSGELTVEAWIVTSSNSPAGGRIVSLSPSIWARDFTLQQSASVTRAYEFPLRSTATSNQGSPFLSTAANAASGQLQHVVFTRNAAGATQAFLNGALVASGTTAGTLSNWDTSFRLSLGNEPQLDRPWLGEYQLVALYSRALTSAEVAQNFAAGPNGDASPPAGNSAPTASIQSSVSSGSTPLNVAFDARGSTDIDGTITAYEWDFGDGSSATGSQVSHTFNGATQYLVRLVVRDDRGAQAAATTTIQVGAPPTGTRVTQGLLALYAFDETSGSIVHDSANSGTPLDLTIQTSGATTWGAGALRVGSPAVIRSPAAATKLITAVKASNALTVEGWIRPTSTQQSGARIISVSPSIWARNVTLGQAALSNGAPTNTQARFEVLFRTTATNSQGGSPGLMSPVSSLATRLMQVVHTREASGAAQLFLDGAQVATTTLSGAASSWDSGFPLVLANEPTGDRPWLGEFHLVALYGRALSPSEVDQNYRAGASGQGGTTSPNLPPTASFTRNPPTGTAPFVVEFDARTSKDSDGAISRFAWSFGDGQSGAGALVSHTYAAPGSFVATLTVTDDDFATTTASQGVTVYGTTAPDTLPTEANLLIAFIGDQGNGETSDAVLNLIKSERAQATVHNGDFDYVSDPTVFDNRITTILGSDYPYFAVVGNHDAPVWDGPNGYGAKITARVNRVPTMQCTGNNGIKANCYFKGLHLVQSCVGTNEYSTGVSCIKDSAEQIAFLRDSLASDHSIWSICSWHKNQGDMQVGTKGDEVGWMAYQECMAGGAIISTGHEHSYARTLTLYNVGNALQGHGAFGAFDQMTLGFGQTFVFVSGLGGNSVRPFDAALHDDDTWWASYYAYTKWLMNGVVQAGTGTHGALFIRFNVGGDPRKALGYFKDINGRVADTFTIVRPQ